MTTDTIQQPYTLRGLTLSNRIVVAPLSIWLAEAGTGLANTGHLVHYGSIAESGPGLIIVEATAVQECGPASPTDLGLYRDEQIAPLRRICDFVHTHTPSKIAIQLNHAGRKGITDYPLRADRIHLRPKDPYGHQCVGPSAIPHSPQMLTPKALSIDEIEQLKKDWVSAAKRAVAAGFDAIEVLSGHGHLLNQFTSPIANHRTDKYGGSLENRLRLPLEIAEEIRKVIPESMPLIYRLSCVDWDPEGVTIEESAHFATELHKRGVDLIDCSSGGVSEKQNVMTGWAYQIDLSEKIRTMTGVSTIAVGNIKTYAQACEIVEGGKADLVAIGRGYLADAYWWRTALVQQGIIPWHPERQRMGFMKSQRKLEAEKKLAEQAEATSQDVSAVAH